MSFEENILAYREARHRQHLRTMRVGSLSRALKRYADLKSRAGTSPVYTNVEVRISQSDFVRWFMPRDFEGCEVDRINTLGHYEIGNIQLLTKKVHSKKTSREHGKYTGEVNYSKLCRGCDKVKPAAEMTKDNRRKDLLSNFCTDCTEIKARLRRLR